MYRIIAVLVFVLVGLSHGNFAFADQPNVLLILVDDLKPAMGAYGDRFAITPNLDRLAKRGMRFDLAYANQAVCAPSRFNLMLGSLSTSSGLYRLGQDLRKSFPKAVTMQQHFSAHGYESVGFGKVFHVGHGNPGDFQSFDRYFKDEVVEYLTDESRESDVTREEAMFFQALDGQKKSWTNIKELGRGAYKECLDVADDAYADGRTADRVIQQLRDYKNSGNRFFISAGFARPHLPFTVPKKYFELHPINKFSLPTFQDAPKGAPKYALRNLLGEMGNYFPCNENVKDDKFRDKFALELIQAYYAATSYVDVQIGKVLDELDRLDMSQNTIVVLWGDHGWHLGDHGRFSKHDNYEQATRIPIIFAGPGVQSGNTKHLVSTVDIYPTLADLAGLPKPKGPQPIDGISLKKVVGDPNVRLRDHITHCYPKKRFGWAVRTKRYRMVQWGGFGKKKKQGPPDFELYDMVNDPNETRNIAAENMEIVSQLRKKFDQYPKPK